MEISQQNLSVQLIYAVKNFKKILGKMPGMYVRTRALV
jgi:hypothetical protein